MKNTKSDRRSERSRRLLGRALIELMAEKKYGDITVQDLLERADIGRSTFYSHYMDKEDLLLSQIEGMVKQLEHHAGGSGEQAKDVLPSLALLHHIEESKHLYKVLVLGGGELNIKKMQARLALIVEQNLAHLMPHGLPPEVPLPVVASYVVTSFLTLVDWWLSSGKGYSAEQVEAMFRRLVMPGVRDLLRLNEA